MKLRDLLKTSLGNLTRHKARTVLTTVGVVVGILTIVTMVSLGIGVQKEMGDAFGSVGLETLSLYPVTEDAGGFDPFGQLERTKLLTPELVAQLQARDDVCSARPRLCREAGAHLDKYAMPTPRPVSHRFRSIRNIRGNSLSGRCHLATEIETLLPETSFRTEKICPARRRNNPTSDE